MVPLLVITNLPDTDSAETLAEALVTQGLAACVNQLAPCHSTYRWQGHVKRDMEVPLLIKTTQSRYAEVQALIDALHPYDVPEVIAVPVVAGLPAYLDWLKLETVSDDA